VPSQPAPRRNSFRTLNGSSSGKHRSVLRREEEKKRRREEEKMRLPLYV
jgi:hypothetical protein